MSPLIDQICIHGDSHQMTCLALIVPNQKNLTEMAAKLGIKGMFFPHKTNLNKRFEDI